MSNDFVTYINIEHNKIETIKQINVCVVFWKNKVLTGNLILFKKLKLWSIMLKPPKDIITLEIMVLIFKDVFVRDKL